MSCAHVTDPVLIDFYARHPALTCARCWLAEMADATQPRRGHPQPPTHLRRPRRGASSRPGALPLFAGPPPHPTTLTVKEG